MTVLNTTSPVATPPAASAPISSPSNAVPSARTSSPSRTVMVACPTAWTCRLVHSSSAERSSPLRLGVDDDRLSRQDRVPDPAPQRHPRVRRVAAAAGQALGLDHPLG